MWKKKVLFNTFKFVEIEVSVWYVKFILIKIVY